MRKADYLMLAELIRKKREIAETNMHVWPFLSDQWEYWRGIRSAVGDIAFTFSEKASVDKSAFLKACGISE